MDQARRPRGASGLRCGSSFLGWWLSFLLESVGEKVFSVLERVVVIQGLWKEKGGMIAKGLGNQFVQWVHFLSAALSRAKGIGSLQLSFLLEKSEAKDWDPLHLLLFPLPLVWFWVKRRSGVLRLSLGGCPRGLSEGPRSWGGPADRPQLKSKWGSGTFEVKLPKFSLPRGPRP